jgi:hypothetical protein
MKMFIFCTFLFLSGVCSGQIVSNGVDLKDVKDDYMMVMHVISAKGEQLWVGYWGIDTTGFAKANATAATKSLKTLLAEGEASQKKMVETCRLKDGKGDFLPILFNVDLYNLMSKSGFSYLYRDAPIFSPVSTMTVTTYVFERRRK